MTQLAAVPAISHELSESKARCCGILQIGARQLRSLIQEGRLVAIGTGHARRITRASLDAEIIARRKKFGSPQIKSGNPPVEAAIRDNALPNFSRTHVEIPADPPQTKTMHRALQHIATDHVEEIGELLSLARAAAAVGLSDRAMAELIEHGRLPSVLIGGRRRVNREILRRWAHGELVEKRKR